MADLKHIRVAALATDGFEESELHDPLRALTQAGARVDILAPHDGEIQAFQHLEPSAPIHVDQTLQRARPDDYDAVLLPGGVVNADSLRVVPKAQSFVRAMQSAGKPFAFICHAPWLLVSADLVRGRKLTSYHTLRDDIRNAGGTWLDQAVVEDGNWLSSRSPKDLSAFIPAMIGLFAHATVALSP
jgi:protease I